MATTMSVWLNARGNTHQPAGKKQESEFTRLQNKSLTDLRFGYLTSLPPQGNPLSEAARKLEEE